MFVLCVCAVCEDMRQNAVSEEEKVLAMTGFQQHIENAQEERSFYKCTAKVYLVTFQNAHMRPVSSTYATHVDILRVLNLGDRDDSALANQHKTDWKMMNRWIQVKLWYTYHQYVRIMTKGYNST